MRTIVILASCAIPMIASEAIAEDLTGSTFGSTIDYVVVVQGDSTNKLNLSQRNTINYAAIQQYGKQNSTTVLQVGSNNGAGVKQRSAAAAFSTDITYLYVYKSGGVSVTAITPFPLAAATFGRAH